ncbi:MAG: hypothetical protein LBT30_03590 [Clostridiales bacterium]|jgi:hypothetical protein|nr:hypothetical protein [Clostridiales bacterium]
MKKKLILTATVLSLVFLLGSCAEAEITYGVYNFSDGSIVFEYLVDIDADTVSNGAYTIDDILTIIDLVFKSYGYATEIGENTVTAQLAFDSKTDLYIYNGLTGDEIPEDDEDFFKIGGFFYNTYVTRMQTVFNDIQETIGSVYTENPIIAELAQEYYSTLASDIASFNYDAFTYVYRYETYYQSIGSDADIVEIDEETGLYSHVFKMTNAERGRTIELTQRSANYFTWAAIALGAAGVTVLILLAFLKAKKSGERA